MLSRYPGKAEVTLGELSQRRSATEVGPERQGGDDGRIVLPDAGDADQLWCLKRWGRLREGCNRSEKMALRRRCGGSRCEMQG